MMNENHKTTEKQAQTPDADPSHRPSGRSEFEGQRTPKPSGMNESLGSGSIPFLGIVSSLQQHPTHSGAKKKRRGI